MKLSELVEELETEAVGGAYPGRVSGLEAAAAAREALPQKVHPLLDRHREPAADQRFELAVTLLADRAESLSAGL